MEDLGVKYTDKQLAQLEKRLQSVYKEAEKDINRKMREFNSAYKKKEKMYAKQVKEGKITEEQFDRWKKGQVFQGKAWQAKKDSITDTLYNANHIASDMLNEDRKNVFGYNFNYASYGIEKGAGINFGFGIYDQDTVARLIKTEPNLLPSYVPKKGVDKAWNAKKITRQITQGVIQGESLDDIANRLAKVTTSQNMDSMKTHARTLMTGAQNAGRVESYKRAQRMGIEVEKQWMATLDNRTRDSHAKIDGESVPVDEKFSNQCMFPGDPAGPPAEIYNCRCTLVSNIKKYPAEYKRRDNIDGQPVSNMTYTEWKKAKYGETVAKKAAKSIDYSKYNGKETFEILKKYKDVDDMIDNASHEEWMHINDFIDKYGADPDKLEKLMQEAKTEGVVKKATKAPAPAKVDDKFSQEKKDAAFWAKSPQQADDMFRSHAGEVWKTYSPDEKQAMYLYTSDSDGFNMPLRGYNGSWRRFEGIGNVPLDVMGRGKEIDRLTEALERTTLKQDTWLQRGVSSWEGLSSYTGIPRDVLQNSSEEQLQQLLVGKEISDAGFLSCGSAKGKGFDGCGVFNYFCPEGTKGAYVEPISRYGGGNAYTNWDGESGQSYLGDELETLLQRNTHVVITKVERDGYGTIYIDADVVSQNPYDIQY